MFGWDSGELPRSSHVPSPLFNSFPVVFFPLFCPSLFRFPRLSHQVQGYLGGLLSLRSPGLYRLGQWYEGRHWSFFSHLKKRSWPRAQGRRILQFTRGPELVLFSISRWEYGSIRFAFSRSPFLRTVPGVPRGLADMNDTLEVALLEWALRNIGGHGLGDLWCFGVLFDM